MEDYQSPVSTDFFAAFAGPLMMWPFYILAVVAGLILVLRKRPNIIGWLLLASVVAPIGNFFLTDYFVNGTHPIIRGSESYKALKRLEVVVFAPLLALIGGACFWVLSSFVRHVRRADSHAHS